jgi:HAE1 family hydrophobic/amphiphilic exporter-1
MRRLTQLFVNRPPLVFVILALVALLGGFAMATLVQQNFPNVDFPTINVSASYPGASPSELRDAVVRPLEDAIAGAPGLDHINTSIQQNQASISASFTLDTNKTTDLVEVQDRILIASSSLPTDLAAPSVRSFDPSQTTVVTMSLSSHSLSLQGLSAIVTDHIVPTLEQVDGISNVNAGGTVTPALEVEVDPEKLAGFGFTADDVASAIQQNNVRAPGGLVYGGNRETSIDVRGDIQTAPTIANLVLTGSTAQLLGATSPSGTVTQKYTGTTGSLNQALQLGSGAVTGAAASATNPWSTSARLPRIGDVATVVDTYEAKRVTSYVGTGFAISLSAQKAAGASEVTAGEAVIAALPQLEAQYPDIQFKVLNVQSDFTKQQLWSVVQTLLEAVVFTGIAMLFFLRSWRNAIVVMIAIPTSLLVTLFAMKLLNFTVDTVSLLAMTLIIGILVDDSIVVLENIERHFEDGEGPRTAAILGRAEIGPAAIVITLVDVVVFLPIAFLPGQVGRFLSEFGVVVTVATLTSLAVSFTITPALAGNWSLLSAWRPWGLINGFSHQFERLRDFYSQHTLAWTLRHGVIVALVCAALTAGALALIPLGFVGFEFIPAVDRGQIFVQVQYPTGTPLTTTDAAIRTLDTAFSQIDDVDRTTSTAGSYQAGFGGGINLGSDGQITVFLKDARKHSTTQIAGMMTGIGHRLVPDAKVIAIPATGTRGGNAQPIDLTLSTTRGEPDAYVAPVLQALSDTPGVVNANSSAQQLSPQMDIEFNRERARALDVNIGTAAQAIHAAFGGLAVTQFDTTNGTKYVQITYPLSYQTKLSSLTNIALRANNGDIVHLGDIAYVKNNPQQALLTRVNRETVVHIGANLEPGATQTVVVQAFMKRLAALHLPDTVLVVPAAGGNQASVAQTAGGLGLSLLLSFLLVYLLMIALYDAYIAPAIIMFSIPVAAFGALGSLAITHQTLNMFSLIGVIMLVGLVSKNGILLVDFAHERVLLGMDKLTAIRQAARARFRPILMTTTSMIAGMLPLALALDAGSASKRSLGTVVIGGLTSSLILTLLLIPVVYMWIAPGPPKSLESGALERDGATARPASRSEVESR